MKNFSFFLILSLSLMTKGFAQTTLTLKAGANNSKTAEVFSLQPDTFYVSDLIRGNAWSFNGSSGIERGFLSFDLSSIPVNSVIQSAYLSLFAPDSPSSQFDFPQSGPNNAWLSRVTSPWGDTTITWNTQPSITSTHAVLLPASTSSYQDYTGINVTQLIQDMVDSSNSYGLSIRLDTEMEYRRLSFCANNFSDTTKRPQLVVTYLLPSPCLAYFTTTSQSDSTDFNYNNALGYKTRLQWNFGDGAMASDSGANIKIAHHYQTSGDYNVCLYTADTSGTCRDTFCKVIHGCSIHAAFTYSLSGNLLTCKSTSSGATRLEWFFGDSTSDLSNNSTVTHTYTLSGQYILTLKVFGDSTSTCSDNTSITLPVVLHGTNTITLQPGVNGKASEVWSLEPTTHYISNLLRGNAWTFGGAPGLERGYFNFDLSGVPANAVILSANLSLFAPTSPSSQFDSPQDGPNSAWLKRVTGSWSADSITWNNQPSSTSVNEVSLPASTSAYEDYQNIDVSNLVRDMVDSSFDSYGFTIQLQTELQSRRLSFCSVNFPDSTKHPKLSILFIAPFSCSAYYTASSKGDSVYFKNYSSANVKSVLWDFGDGTTSTINTSNTLAHHYPAAGIYTACLMTADSSGTCRDTFCREVHACDIHASFTSTINNNTITLTSTSLGASQLHWIFGDGSDFGNSTTVSHTYASAGQYNVSLQTLGDTTISECYDDTSAIIQITIPTPDTLSGVVFDDINGNGVQDAGENGITGASVTLGDNSTVYFHDTTDATGHYKFVVGNGTWKISASYQYPWLQSFPVSPSFYTVSDTIGQSIPSFSFGFYSNQATIAGIVFTDYQDIGK